MPAEARGCVGRPAANVRTAGGEVDGGASSSARSEIEREPSADMPSSGASVTCSRPESERIMSELDRPDIDLRILAGAAGEGAGEAPLVVGGEGLSFSSGSSPPTPRTRLKSRLPLWTVSAPSSPSAASMTDGCGCETPGAALVAARSRHSALRSASSFSCVLSELRSSRIVDSLRAMDESRVAYL